MAVVRGGGQSRQRHHEVDSTADCWPRRGTRQHLKSPSCSGFRSRRESLSGRTLSPPAPRPFLGVLPSCRHPD